MEANCTFVAAKSWFASFSSASSQCNVDVQCAGSPSFTMESRIGKASVDCARRRWSDGRQSGEHDAGRHQSSPARHRDMLARGSSTDTTSKPCATVGRGSPCRDGHAPSSDHRAPRPSLALRCPKTRGRGRRLARRRSTTAGQVRTWSSVVRQRLGKSGLGPASFDDGSTAPRSAGVSQERVVQVLARRATGPLARATVLGRAAVVREETSTGRGAACSGPLRAPSLC
jgi:hypothetical protein